MAIDRSLVSGSMGMMILRLLTEKDMYGYEMIDTLKKRSENVFELKAGTLYPLLHGLEEKQFVTSYEQYWERYGNIIRSQAKAKSIWNRRNLNGRNIQKQSVTYWHWRCEHEDE